MGKKAVPARSDPLTRRDFIKVGGSSVAGLAVPSLTAPTSAQATTGTADYPVKDIARLSDIEPGAVISFTYPDDQSPGLLLRLDASAEGGIGPDQQIVAYSTLCTHKGCPVRYRAERKMLICPCHWSTFDPAKSGNLIIGQASQSLPQIQLRVEQGMVQAFELAGLIYGRHTNIV